jgi:hypothetical protein
VTIPEHRVGHYLVEATTIRIGGPSADIALTGAIDDHYGALGIPQWGPWRVRTRDLATVEPTTIEELPLRPNLRGDGP